VRCVVITGTRTGREGGRWFTWEKNLGRGAGKGARKGGVMQGQKPRRRKELEGRKRIGLALGKGNDIEELGGEWEKGAGKQLAGNDELRKIEIGKNGETGC